MPARVCGDRSRVTALLWRVAAVALITGARGQTPCTGNRSEWASQWGSCSTYGVGESNWLYCARDTATTSNETARDVCSECMQCRDVVPPNQGGLTCGTTVYGDTRHGTRFMGHSAAEQWWSLTPNTSGTYTLDTCESGYDTWIHVVRGPVPTSLSESQSASQNIVQSCDDCGPCGYRTVLTVSLQAGVQYSVVVDGFSMNMGCYRLALSCPGGEGGIPPGPAHDGNNYGRWAHPEGHSCSNVLSNERPSSATPSPTSYNASSGPPSSPTSYPASSGPPSPLVDSPTASPVGGGVARASSTFPCRGSPENFVTSRGSGCSTYNLSNTSSGSCSNDIGNLTVSGTLHTNVPVTEVCVECAQCQSTVDGVLMEPTLQLRYEGNLSDLTAQERQTFATLIRVRVAHVCNVTVTLDSILPVELSPGSIVATVHFVPGAISHAHLSAVIARTTPSSWIITDAFARPDTSDDYGLVHNSMASIAQLTRRVVVTPAPTPELTAVADAKAESTPVFLIAGIAGAICLTIFASVVFAKLMRKNKISPEALSESRAALEEARQCLEEERRALEHAQPPGYDDEPAPAYPITNTYDHEELTQRAPTFARHASMKSTTSMPGSDDLYGKEPNRDFGRSPAPPSGSLPPLKVSDSNDHSQGQKEMPNRSAGGMSETKI